jgi:ubiquinone/menaquinone biosynthesis C-methylase UbiE
MIGTATDAFEEGALMAALDNNAVRDDVVDPGIALQCPGCRSRLTSLECGRCGFRLQFCRGIVRALLPERVAYYARFIDDYERIRFKEGRGSRNEDFYLGLPFEDTSGRNSKQWKIRARSYRCLIDEVLRPLRQGERILDLGAGNGWMSFRLALAGFRPVAVDLLTNEQDGLAAAAHYHRHLPEPFPRFQAEMTRLPFQDEQFDAIVFNASFHYSEDYEASLCEALRCLRIGGTVVISDTPWYSREESGREMVAERHAAFQQKFGTASDSIPSLEYLTDQRLRLLEEKLSVQWNIYKPRYGLKWALRPFLARLRRRREPSRFRIYTATKYA